MPVVDCFPFVHTVNGFTQRIQREPEKLLIFLVGPMQVDELDSATL